LVYIPFDLSDIIEDILVGIPEIWFYKNKPLLLVACFL
jgi:hypothetical protein